MNIQHHDVLDPSLPDGNHLMNSNRPISQIQVKMQADDLYEQWVSASNYFDVSYGLYSAQVQLNYHLW